MQSPSVALKASGDVIPHAVNITSDGLHVRSTLVRRVLTSEEQTRAQGMMVLPVGMAACKVAQQHSDLFCL